MNLRNWIVCFTSYHIYNMLCYFFFFLNKIHIPIFNVVHEKFLSYGCLVKGFKNNLNKFNCVFPEPVGMASQQVFILMLVGYILSGGGHPAATTSVAILTSLA